MKTKFYQILLIVMLFQFISCVNIEIDSNEKIRVEEEENIVTEEEFAPDSNNGTTLEIDKVLENETLNIDETRYYSFTTTIIAEYSIIIYNTAKLNEFRLNFQNINESNYIIGGDIDSYQFAENTIYVIDLTNESMVDVSYNIIVIQGNGQEGSISNPVELNISMDYTKTIGQTIFDYNCYKFTTGNEEKDYRISISSTDLDTEWRLYSDSNFENRLYLIKDSLDYDSVIFVDDRLLTCDLKKEQIGDEICKTYSENSSVHEFLKANTTYYLEIDNNWIYGDVFGYFIINISPIE